MSSIGQAIKVGYTLLLIIELTFFSMPLVAEESGTASGGLAMSVSDLHPQFSDTPNDDGSSITVTWRIPETLKDTSRASMLLRISRSPHREGPFELVGEPSLTLGRFEDRTVQEGKEYFFRVTAVKGATIISGAPVYGPIVPRSSWFDWGRLNALVFLIVFAGLLLYYLWAARSGRPLEIRKVTGLDSVEEAVGRATEMGRKILYIPGIADISEIQTVAGLSILSHIAGKAVEYMTRILVPNIDPLTFAASREIVQEAYLVAGRPDAYRDEDVYFLTSEQFAYTAAVTGLMVREKPAANFFIGWFKAESLMLAETGQATGAIQIAGTAELDQLPFFVASCDYTLIGEELYAASAYLTRQPLLLGGIKAQDRAKLLLICLVLIGVILQFFSISVIHEFLTIH